MDPSDISVPVFDEDPDESFTRPEGLNEFFNEEYEQDEYYDEYYDGEGSYQPEPLETSASQRTAQSEAGHAETVSGHTQFEDGLLVIGCTEFQEKGEQLRIGNLSRFLDVAVKALSPEMRGSFLTSIVRCLTSPSERLCNSCS